MSQKSLRGRTVFVTGAGASMELGFPSGPALMERVVDLLDKAVKLSGESAFLEAVFETMEESVMVRTYTEPKVLEACHDIISYLPLDSSIDNFLFSRSDNPLIQRIGKMAIADVILRAERSSDIYMDRPTPSRLNGAIQNSWLAPLSNLITEKCPANLNSIIKRLSQIAVITFNYDRSFEYYLALLLEGYFRLSKVQTLEALSCIEIHHVYGLLGPIDDGQIDITPYGSLTNSTNLHAISKRIITFNEGLDDNDSRISDMRELLRAAERIIFLGFAFHKQSIGLLMTENEQERVTQNIYGTCMGIAESQYPEIHNRAKAFRVPLGVVPKLENATCAEFLRNYLPTLSFA